MMTQTGNNNPNISVISEMIGDLDQNNDNRIDLKEFITFLDGKSHVINNKNLEYRQ